MIGSLFDNIKKFTHKIAVWDAGEAYSYQRLDRLSDCLATRMQSTFTTQEAKRPAILPVYGERSVEYIIAVLACWKLGIAVAPIAVNTPAKRLQYILEDLQSTNLLACCDLSQPMSGINIISWNIAQLDRQESIETFQASPDLAYVIYTSGTTGQPKGCVIGFDSITPVIDEYIRYCDISTASKMTFTANIAFDAAMIEILPALTAGASLFIIDQPTLLNVNSLANFYAEHKITFSWLPTPITEVLMKDESVNLPLSLKTILTAGQRLTVRPPAHWHTKIENAYGPTETTIIATSSTVSPYGDGLPDIGKPLPGMECFILDDKLEPVKNGEAGQLYIGGIGVSRGYFNRDVLTKEKFISYSHANGKTCKLYASGDICRINQAGNFEYIERQDKQIKLNGFRIELGEIIYHLLTLPKVNQAYVCCREFSGKDYLIGYVVPQQGEQTDSKELKAALAQQVPEYMIPTQIIEVDTFELTNNGKIDETRLPQPDFSGTSALSSQQDVCLTVEEENFLAIFQKHIGAHIGWHSDFFAAGGNSIAAVSISAQVYRKLSLVLPFAVIEQLRQPALIWPSLKQSSFQGTIIKPAPTSNADYAYAPLSSSQRSIWFLASLNPEDRAYHAKARVKLTGEIDANAIQFALQQIVNRHSIFRTSFIRGEGDGLQRIHRQLDVVLQQFDFSHLPEQETEQALEQLLQVDLNQVFKLDELPLVRWALVKTTQDESVLIHIEHHLVHDGWSYNIFLKDFISSYRAYLGMAEADKHLPAQYADYCTTQQAWLSSTEAKQQQAYWQQQLDGAPAKINLPRHVTEHNDPRAGQTIRMPLPRKKWQQIEALAEQRGETIFSVVLSVFNLMLARYSGDRDICVGSAFSNRNWINADEIIGMMINTVVLRTRLSQELTLNELLQGCFSTVSEAQKNQSLPFEYLVNSLNIEREAGINPLFQVFLGFHDSPMPDLDLPGIETAKVMEAIDSKAAKFDLSLIVIPRDEQEGDDNPVHMLWEFKTSVYSPWLIEQMMAEFYLLMDQVLTSQSGSINSLTGQSQVLKGVITPVSEQTIFSRFQHRAKQDPNAVAIEFDGTRLSYQALLEKVETKIQVLLQHGIHGGETKVGICLPRGTDMLVWFLACQAAGAAYIPLDPGYPKDRIDYIIKHSQLNALIGEGNCDFDCLNIHAQAEAVGAKLALPRVNLSDPMYIIYTSGSTGLPKGVVISHHAFANFIDAMSEQFPLQAHSRWLALTSCSFDISTLELFLPLISGATIIMARDRDSRDPKALAALMQEHKVSHCQATPTTWRSLVESGWQGDDQLTILCGGEPLDIPLAQSLQNLGAALFNMYGPTETTVWSMIKQIKQQPVKGITLGLPINNTRIHLLDKQGRAVPPGAIGQLWISGDGLALGYLHNDQLTRERFVTDKAGLSPRYYTGDLASLNSHGELVFHGRDDNQVKLRGYRIELGEIEQVIRQLPTVKDVVVVVQKVADIEQLIAFVVAGKEQQESIQAHCQQHLPLYMLPNHMLLLDKLPQTPNGKVDRNALPDIKGQNPVHHQPESETEIALAEIFRPRLGHNNIDIQASLYQLGGNSLMAMRLSRDIEASFGVPMNVSDFMDLGTVNRLATYIDSLTKEVAQENIVEEFSI
ncbi:non-ribosomal peptide synthetase [Thalassomonas haliotis]|uniref:Amino acid adenylation domain-containing protein n=1 Tax=Thalassomonas haliotis TaxID=485448 RepID=A0ABY7VGL3_9GAMM|nr:non-ribosomal peptide synthetase [Thalassomonas haliotis]WDE11817.1 amino acid adenylation domain-containing protein [Thalassomonas haliotis]